MIEPENVSRTPPYSKTVPVWQLVTVALAVSLLAWLNVRYTFAFVNVNLSSPPILKLIGSYLPHGLLLLFCVFGMMIRVGRLSLQDLGLRNSDIPIAICVTLGFWLIIAIRVQAAANEEEGSWNWNSQLASAGGLGLFADLLVTQILGNALVEELVFRGYFFRQIYARCHQWMNAKKLLTPTVSFAIALLLSLLLFVACHLPIRLHNGLVGSELIQNLVRVAIWGTLFTSLFAATRNLWLVIGIHAITNRPCLWAEPVVSPRSDQLVLFLVILLISIACRHLPIARSRTRRVDDREE